MSVRVRPKRTQAETEDHAWPAQRDYLVRYFPGDDLLECRAFWEGEPGVPDELRTDPERWQEILAPLDIAAAIRARRADLLKRRRRWLVRAGYRWPPAGPG